MNEPDRDMSLRFYNYLCDKIGTEHEVQARRTYFATLDYICHNDECPNISSGSKAEGLNMKSSDYDIMILLNRFKVLNTIVDDLSIDQNTFVMVTDDTKPGYTKLRLCGFMDIKYINDWCVPYENTYLLSSENIKKWYLAYAENNFLKKDNLIHGPCISDKEETIDIALCLRCQSWIHQAGDWIKRSRNWPSAHVVSHIISNGVLFVPIGCKGSPNEDVEWRISFSIPEKQLIFAFSHVQLLCYGLLKIFLKEIIDKKIILKGLLCSYFLKTIMLWVSEEVPVTSWQPSNTLSCFMHCLRRLIYCVNYSILPHYFITDNNLFEKRFSSQEGAYLNSLLNEFYQRGPICLTHSDSMCDFFRNSQRFSSNIIRIDFGILISQLQSVIQLHSKIFRNYIIPSDIMKNFFSLRKKGKQSGISYIIFCQTCQEVGKTSPLGFCNKACYQIHKQYLPYLLLGLRTDAVSGWLYLATYCYCQNQYELSLKIIEYVLSKCTPEKLYYNDDILTVDHLDAIERQALQRDYLNISSLHYRHLIKYIQFRKDNIISDMIPCEIVIPLKFNNVIYQPPVVYAHFLSFLCSYKLKDIDGCQKNLHALVITMCGEYFMGNNIIYANSFNSLGIAFYMLGKLDLSAKVFIHSFDLDAKQKQFVNFMLGKMKNIV